MTSASAIENEIAYIKILIKQTKSKDLKEYYEYKLESLNSSKDMMESQFGTVLTP